MLNKRTATAEEIDGAVYIGRPGKWGNQFIIDEHSSREDVIRRYEQWLRKQPRLLAAAKRELRGRNLLCWCAPKACHGDILLRIANED